MSADRLARELGAAPPPGLIAALGDDELERLAGLIAVAREEQAAELERAMDAALGYVPRLARGTVRRLLFG
jgi:hypothetical protein